MATGAGCAQVAFMLIVFLVTRDTLFWGAFKERAPFSDGLGMAVLAGNLGMLANQ